MISRAAPIRFARGHLREREHHGRVAGHCHLYRPCDRGGADLCRKPSLDFRIACPRLRLLSPRPRPACEVRRDREAGRRNQEAARHRILTTAEGDCPFPAPDTDRAFAWSAEGGRREIAINRTLGLTVYCWRVGCPLRAS